MPSQQPPPSSLVCGAQCCQYKTYCAIVQLLLHFLVPYKNWCSRAATPGLKMRIRSRTIEHGRLHDQRTLVVPPCVALEIRCGKGFERLHEARQGCLYHASADLPDPRLAMGNARVDPGHDSRFDDLPYVNPARHSQLVERRQPQMGVTPGGNLQHLLGIAAGFGPPAHTEKLRHGW